MEKENKRGKLFNFIRDEKTNKPLVFDFPLSRKEVDYLWDLVERKNYLYKINEKGQKTLSDATLFLTILRDVNKKQRIEIHNQKT